MPTKTARERFEILWKDSYSDFNAFPTLLSFIETLLEEARQDMKEECLKCIPDDMFFGNEYERGQNDSRNEIRNSILSL